MTEAASRGDELVRVSVIVPVRNRRDLLIRLLEALDQQTVRDFEVIVVDDGSTDGSAEAALRVVVGRWVRVLASRGAGAVAAREGGVAAARGDILAFTDSDCVPAPGWVEHGVAAIDRGADVVNGLTLPARPVFPLERSVASGEESLYPTCNVFYRRSAFDAAGGFDSSAAQRWGFRFSRKAKGLGFGEDTLLGWRVRRRGVAVHEPLAVVEHHVFPPDFREWLSRGVMLASFPAILREIPELQGTLAPRRILFLQYSRVPLYVAVATLVLRRPRATRTMLLVWVGAVARSARRTGAPWRTYVRAIPALLVLDAVNAGALIIGSARAHRLFL